MTVGDITINDDTFALLSTEPKDISQVQRVLAGISSQNQALKEISGF